MKILELNTVTSVLVKINRSYENILIRENSDVWIIAETRDFIWDTKEIEALYQKRLIECNAKEVYRGNGKIVGTCCKCGSIENDSLSFNESELICSDCNNKTILNFDKDNENKIEILNMTNQDDDTIEFKTFKKP